MTKKGIIAAGLAAVTVFSTMISGGQNAFAKSDRVFVLPSWVPDDYDSALEFYNTHGATLVEDAYACVVFKKHQEDINDSSYDHDLRYEITYGSEVMQPVSVKEYSESQISNPGAIVFEVYLFCAIDEGTFSVELKDTLGDNLLAEVSNDRTLYSFSVDSELYVTETDIYSWLPDCEAEYEEYVKENSFVSVKDNNVVFCLDQNAGTAYKWREKSKDYEGIFQYLGSRTCTPITSIPLEGGVMHDVEIYRAIGDGEARIELEYGRFFKDTDEPNDTLSADCAVFNEAQSVLLANQARISVLDEATGELISDEQLQTHPFSFTVDIRYKRDAPPDGWINSSKEIIVTENPSIVNTILAIDYLNADYFEFCCDEEPEVRTYGNGSIDIVFKTKLDVSGDVNGDSKFSVADAVILQKWLLGYRNDENFKWENADLYKDDKLDIFDLVVLRKKLIESFSENQIIEKTIPVLALVDEASWKNRQNLIIFDDKGYSYRVDINGETAEFGDIESPHFENDFTAVSMKDGDDWYSRFEDIISRPYSRFNGYELDKETLSHTKELAMKTEELRTEKWLDAQGNWIDGSTLSVYLINKEPNGKTIFAKLCTFYSSHSCLDNEDVKDYIRELIRKDYIASEYEQYFESYLDRAKKQ